MKLEITQEELNLLIELFLIGKNHGEELELLKTEIEKLKKELFEYKNYYG